MVISNNKMNANSITRLIKDRNNCCNISVTTNRIIFPSTFRSATLETLINKGERKKRKGGTFLRIFRHAKSANRVNATYYTVISSRLKDASKMRPRKISQRRLLIVPASAELSVWVPPVSTRYLLCSA